QQQGFFTVRKRSDSNKVFSLCDSNISGGARHSLTILFFGRKSLLVKFIFFICVEYQIFDILLIGNLYNN
ncbi:hypothetical protein, partial [Lysinibacillus sp. FJAT-14222]|uniref:hypothetical protein n=1 Tax=Lysinibacillus sp. FJAT-14222 TaxID=1932366 RepID=UPI0019D71761